MIGSSSERRTDLVVAIDANTGAELWRTPISPSGSRSTRPARSATDRSRQPMTIASWRMDPSSGEIRWRHPAVSTTRRTPIVATVSHSLELRRQRDWPTRGDRRGDGNEVWRVEEGLTHRRSLARIGYTGSARGPRRANDLTTGDRALASDPRRHRARARHCRRRRLPDAATVSAGRRPRSSALAASSGRSMSTPPTNAASRCRHGMVFVGTAAGTVYAIGGDGPDDAAGPPPVGHLGALRDAIGLALPTPPPLETDLVWAGDSGTDDFNPWGCHRRPTDAVGDRGVCRTASRSSRPTASSSSPGARPDRATVDLDLTRGTAIRSG